MSEDRIESLEERVEVLERAVLRLFPKKAEDIGIDEDAPPLTDRMKALEALMAKVAYWIDRRENETKSFAEDFRKAYVEVDWKWR